MHTQLLKVSHCLRIRNVRWSINGCPYTVTLLNQPLEKLNHIHKIENAMQIPLNSVSSSKVSEFNIPACLIQWLCWQWNVGCTLKRRNVHKNRCLLYCFSSHAVELHVCLNPTCTNFIYQLQCNYEIYLSEGNDVYGPKFNLGFGGRRNFCDTEYADLGECFCYGLFA